MATRNSNVFIDEHTNNGANFVGEITEFYHFPFHNTTQNYRKASKSVVSWKGVNWNVMTGINDKKKVGFFLGFDDSDHLLPKDWAVTLRYKFELLDKSNLVIRGRYRTSLYYTFFLNFYVLIHIKIHYYYY